MSGQKGYNLDEFEDFMNREMHILGLGHRLGGTPSDSFSVAASTNPKQVFAQIETDRVPSERLMWPILPFRQLNVDSDDEENGSEIFSWCDDGKVVDYLEDNGDESSSDDEFIESILIGRIKNEKDQRNIDNDVMEPCGIKKETIDIKGAVEELNYSHKGPIKSEFIKQEELYIKDEVDNVDMLQRNYHSQGPFIQQEGVHVISQEEGKKKLNNNSRKPSDQLVLRQCPECPYSTTCKGYLRRHSIKHKEHKKSDKTIWYNCHECPYKASLKDKLKRHVKIHNSEKSISKCSKQSSKETNFKIEHKTDIQRLNYCSECSYETHLQSNFDRHSLTHKRDAFKCTNCEYRTGKKHLLVKHQNKHVSKDKWHSCPLCTFKTFDKSVLRKHSLRRHNVNPNTNEIVIFKCTECSYKSGYKYYLKRHQLIHDQSGWLQCPDCLYKTPYKNRFKEHQVRHQGQNAEGWYRCQECTYKTADKSNLRSHVMLHTKPENKIRQFECSQCSFKTADKNYLKRHQSKHKEGEDIEWFCCCDCPFKSIYKRSLRKHIFIKHKKQVKKGYLENNNKLPRNHKSRIKNF